MMCQIMSKLTAFTKTHQSDLATTLHISVVAAVITTTLLCRTLKTEKAEMMRLWDSTTTTIIFIYWMEWYIF